MKILFLHPCLDDSGASKMLAYLANHYADVGHSVVMGLLENNIGEFQNLQTSIKCTVLSCATFSVWSEVSLYIRIRKFIKREDFDFCIAFLNPAKVLALWACKGLKTKVILSERGNLKADRGNKGYLSRLFVHDVLPYKYVFQTEFAKKQYSEKIQQKGVIIPNPIWDDSFSGMYNYLENRYAKVQRIIHVGRLDRVDKRQDILIHAFYILLEKFHCQNIELVFVGDGPDKAELMDLAMKLGISDKVLFKGYQKTVYEELLHSTVFCLTSDNEGIPNALLEALSVGIPCVSTDYAPGGVRVLIPNENCGSVVSRGDIDAIARELYRLLSDKSIWEKTGKGGANFVNKQFSRVVINSLWDSVIE